MFYQFELVLAGIILLTAMALGGFSLWRKRRNAQLEQMEQTENDEQNL
jgi:LPXTG-motif cell wall-anchored protein